MGTPVAPKPVKYFSAFLLSDLMLLSAIESEISVRLDDYIDYRGTLSSWQASAFYQAEMGVKLWRGYWSFDELRGADQLAAIKLLTQEIEDKFRDPVSGGRRVNLDPGYLDVLKVVLASTKNANQRIYLHSGIYAEATLFFHHGAFHGQSYTYPDYLTSRALEFFAETRTLYLAQLRRFGMSLSTH